MLLFLFGTFCVVAGSQQPSPNGILAPAEDSTVAPDSNVTRQDPSLVFGPGIYLMNIGDLSQTEPTVFVGYDHDVIGNDRRSLRMSLIGEATSAVHAVAYTRCSVDTSAVGVLSPDGNASARCPVGTRTLDDGRIETTRVVTDSVPPHRFVGWRGEITLSFEQWLAPQCRAVGRRHVAFQVVGTLGFITASQSSMEAATYLYLGPGLRFTDGDRRELLSVQLTLGWAETLQGAEVRQGLAGSVERTEADVAGSLFASLRTRARVHASPNERLHLFADVVKGNGYDPIQLTAILEVPVVKILKNLIGG